MRAVIVFGLCAQTACVRELAETATKRAPGPDDLIDIRQRGTTQFGNGGVFERAPIKARPKASDGRTLTLPKLWLDFMQMSFTYLGKGAYGIAYVAETWPVARSGLQVGTIMKVEPEVLSRTGMTAGANGEVTFKGWNSSGRVFLEGGRRLDVFDIKYKTLSGGWEPLGFQPGRFVLKHMEIVEGIYGQRWRDYSEEARYMHLVDSPYTMPAYGSFPPAADAAHRDFWIMMPVMDGGEVDQSVRMVFQKKYRNGLSTFMNYIGTFVGRPDYMALENGTDFQKHTVRKHRLMIPIFLDALYGLEDTHARVVFHCDLKPQNILVSSKECVPEHPGKCHARIADFGVSCGGRIRDCRGHRAGTPSYWPPEAAINGASCSAAQDLWAMGLTLYSIWDSRLPGPLRSIRSMVHLKAELAKFIISEYFQEDMFASVKQAIQSLMHRDPAQRNLRVAIQELERAHVDLGLGRKQRMAPMAPPDYMDPLLKCVEQKCQYACKQGQPGCLCPDGMQLASDGRSCRMPPGSVERGFLQVWNLVSDCVAGFTAEEDPEDVDPGYFPEDDDNEDDDDADEA